MLDRKIGRTFSHTLNYQNYQYEFIIIAFKFYTT